MFGYSHKNCHIDFKCMKCGKNYSTHLCEKPTTTPPKYANCEGEHQFTYIRCPNNPVNTPAQKVIEAQIPKENPWTKKREVKTEEKIKKEIKKLMMN